MNAIVEKTVHFNCPYCHNEVAAPETASGKLISCPSCGCEFNSPKPASKAHTSWLLLFGLGILAAGTLIGVPVGDIIAHTASGARLAESPGQLHLRLENEARSALAQQVTVAVVGLRAIINQDTQFLDLNPDHWTAEVTADYINPVGGVQRETLPFSFWTYRSPADGRDHVLCRVDDLKISQARHDELAREFGVAAMQPKAGH